MFEEILMSALSELDDDALNYILESCTEDELNYIDMAIEAVSDADRDQLRSGYKLDVHNGLGGLVKSFKNSGTDKWKNLAHDAKTEFTRVKNNLKGDGDQTTVHFGDNAAQKVKNAYDDSLKRAKNARDTAQMKYGMAGEEMDRNSSEYKNTANKLNRIYSNAVDRVSKLKSDDYRKRVSDKIADAYANNKDAQRNVGSLSYRLGNGLKTLRNTVKSKIDAWKAKRQQNQT